MPFGRESTEDVGNSVWNSVGNSVSPMPFGRESTWDEALAEEREFSRQVTNAFRQGVHWGRSPCIPRPICVSSRHQCLSAGSPLGTPRDVVGFAGGPAVTNAFRQGVHWGLNLAIAEACGWKASPMPFGRESTGDNSEDAEEFLAWAGSPMPFGRESTGDARRGYAKYTDCLAVTNAFRQGVHWGLVAHAVLPLEGRGRHQCLSAGSPLGTLIWGWRRGRICRGHQCLSAGSPLGTAFAATAVSVIFYGSPMPFGRESTGDQWR